METNRIEGIARDGIRTAAEVTKATVHGGGEAAAEALTVVSKLVRDATQTVEDASVAALGALGRVLGSASQVSERAIDLTRGSLGGMIEVAGSRVRTAVRVGAEVAIEVVYSVRRAAAVLLAVEDEVEETARVRAINGSAADLAS